MRTTTRPSGSTRDGGGLPARADPLDVERDADPGEPALGARPVAPRVEAGPVGELERRVEGALVVAGVVREAERRPVREAVGRDHVAPAQLDRVDPELGSGEVDEPLDHERGFRAPGAAIRPRRHLRRADADHLDVGGRDLVAADEQHRCRLWSDRRRRVEVGAEVADQAGAQREHAAVGVERELGVDVQAAPLVDGERALGPRLRPLHGPPERDRGERDRGRLGLRCALAAERAADVGDDDVELLGRAAQHLRQPVELAVRVLRGEPEREDVGGGVVRGEDDARLERRRDQPRRPDARPHDGVRPREGAVDVALGAAPAQEHVVRRLLVQRRRALGLARLDERRQLLDLDQDVLRRVRGLLGGVGDDERDRLADVADAVAREHRVRHRHDLGAVAHHQRERVDEPLDVGGGEDRPDARHPRRHARVDAGEPPVRVDAAHERGVQHLRQLQVADVLRLALDEALVLGARQRPPDPGLRGSGDRAHAASSGSKGIPCRHSAPASPTTVSAPS